MRPRFAPHALRKALLLYLLICSYLLIPEVAVNRLLSLPGLLLLTLLAAGCTSSRVPPPDLSGPRAAIADADQAGAAADAPLELRNARLKLEQAQSAINRGDHERARIFAEQAQVDAKYAEARARSVRAQMAVDELREGIRVLREEIERSRQGAR